MANKLTILILLSIIALIHCLPLQSNSYNTPSTTLITSKPTLEAFLEKRDDDNEKDKIKEAFDIAKQKKEEAKALAEAAKEKIKEEKDKIQEQNNNEKSTSYGKHQDADNNNDDDDNKKDDDDKKDKDKDKDGWSKTPKATATNTVVTTVVVVSTESPTVIYSDTNSNPSKQKGDTSANHQVNDPNSTTSSTSSSSSETPGQSSRGAQGRSNYHKLVLALSIVGSVAAIAIFAGLFVLTRVKLRKRREAAKKPKDEESNGNDDTTPPSPPSRQMTPPPNARLSPLPNNDTTLVAYTENPFSDPTPSAPPPAVLSDTYPQYRQNRTLSMLSQTTAIPSAPTAKELDAMDYENPFEEEYGTSSHNHADPPHSPSRSILQQHLPPPPAYTPSAIPTVIPSAPPLYALPQTEDDEHVSRRYSTSSCSDIQVSRPPSVRRGSRTITHIIP